MEGLSWSWILLMASGPPAAAVLAAYPFWRRRAVILGNIAGTGILFGSAFMLILREHLVLDRLVQECLDAGTTCWPEPSAFTRFAIYAFIALVEVLALFTFSITVEDRLRRRDYAPEWRR